MHSIPEIPINQYDYPLPEERIAQSALEPRDSSRLLHYHKGELTLHVFKELPEILNATDQLIFNDTKVIPARIFTQNKHGAKIEVFLLHPLGTDHSMALASTETTTWACLIGNSKKWKREDKIQIDLGQTVLILTRDDDQAVNFSWAGGLHFSEILQLIGKIPLPPYIRHEASDEDARRYQTVFSKVEGSVAAPTAGLHFTNEVLETLRVKGVLRSFITLHVGAGTFLPVKVEDASKHPMHSESFEVSRLFVESLNNSRRTIVVGTTACRVMESLYYLALKILTDPEIKDLSIGQFDYIGEERVLSKQELAKVLLDYMDRHGMDVIKSRTSIMIVPGYKFRLVEGLVTNFHQPKSTLLLLISALIGEDWRQVYESALSNGFRFLSYGDSSLLVP